MEDTRHVGLVRIEHEMGRPRGGKVRVDVGVGVSEGSGEVERRGPVGAAGLAVCRGPIINRASAFSCRCPSPSLRLDLC